VFIEIGDMMTQASYTTVSRALTSFSIVIFFAAACLSTSAYANQNKKGATSLQQASQDDQAEPMEVPGVFKSGIPTTGDITQKQSAGTYRKRVSEIPVDVDSNKGAFGAKRTDRKTAQLPATPKDDKKSEAKTILIPKQLVDGLVEKSDASDFHATAYCLKGRTATGEQVRQGFIAADPKVLPLGTMVHIEAGKYTGVYRVADTGGRIRGNRIDIYVPNAKEAKLFGRKRIKVKVIKHR
jgi:3D (Asp-Asp-Asp) domain-containing protein